VAGGIPWIRIHSPPPFETAPRLDKKKPRSFGMTGAKAGIRNAGVRNQPYTITMSRRSQLWRGCHGTKKKVPEGHAVTAAPN
jgi:hypothetical protein